MINNLTSIVIPNWFTMQGGKYTSEAEAFWFALHAIDKLKKFTKEPYELILIDNGCELGSRYLMREADTYIRNERNLGFAPACNQGFEAAKGEWICCFNNDIFVWPGWLEALKLTFKEVPDCGIAMPALDKRNKDAKEILKMPPHDLIQNWGEYSRHAEFGSCWLTKKKYLDTIKSKDGFIFNEKFKIGFGEDRDLWSRIRHHLNLETYRTHKTRVFHQGNVTIGKIPDRKKYTHKNRELLKKMKEQRGY